MDDIFKSEREEQIRSTMQYLSSLQKKKLGKKGRKELSDKMHEAKRLKRVSKEQ